MITIDSPRAMITKSWKRSAEVLARDVPDVAGDPLASREPRRATSGARVVDRERDQPEDRAGRSRPPGRRRSRRCRRRRTRRGSGRARLRSSMPRSPATKSGRGGGRPGSRRRSRRRAARDRPRPRGIAIDISRLPSITATTSPADRRRVGVELVGGPGRVVPRPPDRQQDDGGLAGALPVRCVQQRVRDLRDREDEDEVVEELERRGARVAVRRLGSGVAGHRGKLSRCRPDQRDWASPTF